MTLDEQHPTGVRAQARDVWPDAHLPERTEPDFPSTDPPADGPGRDPAARTPSARAPGERERERERPREAPDEDRPDEHKPDADRPDAGGGKGGPSGEKDEGKEDEADEDGKPSLWRRHPLWFVFGGLALLLVAAAVFLYWLVALHPYESTDDAFVDSRQFAVAPKVSGYVVDVPVTDNQFVREGDTLFQIDRRDYEVALEQARAQIDASDASIRNIDSQIEAQKSTIEEAKAQVTQTQAALQFARQDAARYQDLAQRGAGTVQQQQQSTSNLEQQQASLARANASVSGAQQQIASLQAQRANAEANLAASKAQRDQAQLNLGYTTVVAAQPGRIVRLTGAKGQFAQAGQSLTMFVPSAIWVTANYKETQINDMRAGQPVDVRIDAYPGRRITGRIDSVQPGSGTAFSLLPAENATGNYVKVVQRVPVKILVDRWPDDVSIGPGMSVVPTAQVRPEPDWWARYREQPADPLARAEQRRATGQQGADDQAEQRREQTGTAGGR